MNSVKISTDYMYRQKLKGTFVGENAALAFTNIAAIPAIILSAYKEEYLCSFSLLFAMITRYCLSSY